MIRSRGGAILSARHDFPGMTTWLLDTNTASHIIKGDIPRVQEFLARVEVLPWTSAESEVHAELHSACERGGVPLAPLDLLIAAQAMAP